MLFLYFLIALLATTAGALTGMGGGVILKPVLDALGGFDAATVNILAASTVFCMTAVSIGRRLFRREKLSLPFIIPLSAGSVAGGYIGQFLLARLIKGMSGELTVALQNAMLALLIVGIFIYMLCKHRLKSPRWSGIPAVTAVGLALGLLSSFLGIGGGPFNVALLILLFALDTKTAVFYSLTAIFFAQSAKLVTVAISGGLGQYDLSLLPPLAIGAVAGGLIGSTLSGKLSDRAVELSFNGIQAVVLVFCIINIIKSL